PDWKEESWAVETHGFVGKSAHGIAGSLAKCPCLHPVHVPLLMVPYFSSISELDLKLFLLDEKNLMPKKMVVMRKMSARASRTQPPAVAWLLVRDMPRKSASPESSW
ncbi:hypothetical protein N332_04850, partial [Mesitornis unicolor]